MVTRNLHKECLEALIKDLEFEQEMMLEIAHENPSAGNIVRVNEIDRIMELVDARLYELDQQLDGARK